MKSEPSECSIDDLAAARAQTVPWVGVRNYQARNFMRDLMRIGDGVLTENGHMTFSPVNPRWLLSDAELAVFSEATMPNPDVQPLFDRARELGVGFSIGYAEREGDSLFNSAVLVAPDGRTIGKYRKVHLPGSVEPRLGDRYHQLAREHAVYLPGRRREHRHDADRAL